MLNWNISGQTSCQSDGRYIIVSCQVNNIINIDWEIDEMEASEKASTNYARYILMCSSSYTKLLFSNIETC